MTRPRPRFLIRELLLATLLAGLVIGAFAVRARHPGRPEDVEWMILGAVAVASLLAYGRMRPLLYRLRLRSLAREHAPSPRPSRYRPPDHSDILASRRYARTPEPRPIARDRP